MSELWQPRFDWTADRVETLKTMWADGASGTEIANAIGDGVTRNAVIGKVHRMNIARTFVPPPSNWVKQPMKQIKPRKRKPKARKGGADGGIAHRLVIIGKPEPLPVSIEDMDIPIEQRRTLMQLDAMTCRWPVGTPGVDLFFCGARPIDGSPYCQHHTRRSCTPGTARRPNVSEGLR